MIKYLSIVFMLPFLVQKDEEAGEFSSTPIDSKYFWNKTLDIKSVKNQTDTFNDTISNGFYSTKEIVTYKNKKTMAIQYLDGIAFKKVETLNNGTGFITPQRYDTLYLVDGMLNGDSYLYHHYPINKLAVGVPIMSERPIYRRVLTLENNCLKRERDYFKGILVAETFFKNFYFINKDNKKNSYPYNIDGTQTLYFTTGTVKEIRIWQKKQIIKQTWYDKSGNVKKTWPK